MMMQKEKFQKLVDAVVECLEEVEERAVDHFGDGSLCEELSERLLEDGVRLSVNDDDQTEAEAIVAKLVKNKTIKWNLELIVARLLSHLEGAQELASMRTE
jgi:hypothetical protein